MMPRELEARLGCDDFFFIQVGANDGRLDDMLHDLIKTHHWKGVLIEPLPHVFERLLETYKGLPDLAFECTAISNYEGSCDLWVLPREAAESEGWDLSVLATTRRHLFTHELCIDPSDKQAVDSRLVTVRVPCTTLQRIVEIYRPPRLDLLHIDVQGSDFEVIQSLDFSRIKPLFINYEDILLEERGTLCERFLTELGYRLMPGLDERYDTMAVLVND